MRLDRDDIEAIADRVVERLADGDRRRVSIGLATAADVAKLYGVTPSWVYATKKGLGAVKLGDGPKARLKFDLERVEHELRRHARSRPTKYWYPNHPGPTLAGSEIPYVTPAYQPRSPAAIQAAASWHPEHPERPA